MKEKRKFKGRVVPCPNCHAKLRSSWLSGMSNHSAFMYSKKSDAILVLTEQDWDSVLLSEFSFENPLRCPVCQFKIVTRSADPSLDKAIFLERMKYITGDREFEVVVET